MIKISVFRKDNESMDFSQCSLFCEDNHTSAQEEYFTNEDKFYLSP
jgi:hypothetical protein